MRTTIDLEAGLLKRLRVEARRRGVTIKELLATIVRRGLDDKAGLARRYRTPVFSMGTHAAGTQLDKALSLAADIEDEETVRELALRK